MKQPYINLHAVDLHYAAVAFKERSLKSLLAGALKIGSKKAEVKDVHALKNISLQIRGG